MKRVNIQQAFVGEPDGGQEGVAADTSSNEAIEYEIEGGTITLIVPPQTNDDKAMSAATGVQGELRLEGGRQLTFFIYEDAENAGFEADETTRPVPTEAGQGMAGDLSTAYEDGTVTTTA